MGCKRRLEFPFETNVKVEESYPEIVETDKDSFRNLADVKLVLFYSPDNWQFAHNSGLSTFFGIFCNKLLLIVQLW
jgi:hypothetical protein